VVEDPESKGGSEATVRVAKRTGTDRGHLLSAYGSFQELVEACEAVLRRSHARPHRETRRPPGEMLSEERNQLHLLPVEPYTAALGETRQRRRRPDRPLRLGGYSTHGLGGPAVWCSRGGEELVIVGAGEQGPPRRCGVISCRCLVSRRILPEHYPDHPMVAA